jgi:hypothetical protein
MENTTPASRGYSAAKVAGWIVAALALYALSVGPVNRVAIDSGNFHNLYSSLSAFYTPLFWTADKVGLGRPLHAYLFLWAPELEIKEDFFY